MRLRDAAFLALSSLRGCAARTLLTILGLGVGVGAVLTVQTLGAAGETEVEREIARLGVDKVWITAADGAHSLTEESAQQVSETVGLPACAGACTAGLITLAGQEAIVQIAGYDSGMEAVYGAALKQGRLFQAEDHAHGRAVCIMDAKLAESLGGDVVGRRVTVGGRRCLVVGVVEGMPLRTMALGSGMLAMPLSAYCDTFGGGVQELTISVPPGQAAGEISERLLSALGREGYRADSLESEIDAARQIVRIFVMVLSCVAAVCMLTGAIGVMNVLLVSVRERRREIGLMKALGGTSAQVGLIFLIEAAAYASLGGLLGLAAGAVLIRLFGAWVGLEAALKAGDAAPVMLAASGLGIVFGVAPALRAAGMQVVEALRCE